jgi:hypothetical protein
MYYGLNIKMTDLEKFIDTYKQFGIELESSEDCEGNIEIVLNSEDDERKNIYGGYKGFFSIVKFTKQGKFLKQAFWE